MKTKMKIGIFGGTFNPVHNAHLSIARSFIDEIQLDVCYFVPAWLSPFKVDISNEVFIPATQRTEMLKIALEKEPKFQIDTFEIDKMDISYSIETINHFINKYHESEFYLLIGSDQLMDFHKWKDYEQILNLVQICIAERPGFQIFDKYLYKFTINGKKPKIISSQMINISSTEIRNCIINHLPLTNLLPKLVEEYILNNNLLI